MLIGPAKNQMSEINFQNNDLVEVDDLKGFAIFFNMSKFYKDFFDENFFFILKKLTSAIKLKKIKEKFF